MANSNLIRIGVPTSRHMGINEKTKEGPLREFLAGQHACEIYIEQALASGEPYPFIKGNERGHVQAVYQPAAVIPSRTSLDDNYEQAMKVGITGKDHWVEWMFASWLFNNNNPSGSIYTAGVNPHMFEARLREYGLVQLADLGFNPVYHVIAKPNAAKGNPLENGNLVVSSEYPIELASYLLFVHQPTLLTQGTPLTLKFKYPNAQERVLHNEVQGQDRKVIEILVTTGKTEYAGGVIAELAQSGQSLVGKFEPLVVIGSSTPLMVANASLGQDYPKFMSSLKVVAEKATETARERHPEMFVRGFETAFDNAPGLIRDYERLVASFGNGNGNSHLAEELFRDPRQLSLPIG